MRTMLTKRTWLSYMCFRLCDVERMTSSDSFLNVKNRLHWILKEDNHDSSRIWYVATQWRSMLFLLVKRKITIFFKKVLSILWGKCYMSWRVLVICIKYILEVMNNIILFPATQVENPLLGRRSTMSDPFFRQPVFDSTQVILRYLNLLRI